MCGLRITKLSDQIVAQKERIQMTEADRIVKISVENQGTLTVMTTLNGGEQGIAQLLPGQEVEYFINGSILTGSLLIDFVGGAGTQAALVTKAYDVGELCE